MNPIVTEMLKGLKGGEMAAAMILADYLEDTGSHLAPLVRPLADIVGVTESFLDVLLAAARIIDLLENPPPVPVPGLTPAPTVVNLQPVHTGETHDHTADGADDL